MNCKIPPKINKNNGRNLTRLIPFALVFTVFGGYMVVRSFAATPSCTTTLTSSQSVSSAVNTAAAGSTICLADGTYSGTVTLSGVSKSSDVTIQSVNDKAASISLDITNSSHLKFQNLTIRGLEIAGSSAKNISVLDSTFTGPSFLDMRSNSNANILIDGNTFNGIDKGSSNYEGRLTVGQPAALGSSPVGVTVSNNVFGGGGCSDGIQIGAYGVVVLNNEFKNITQSCSSSIAHVDALQLYGSSHTVIDGNYFHDNEDCIMAPDGTNTETITNNVCTRSVNYGFTIGSDKNSVIDHNTFGGSSGGVRVYEGNNNVTSTGTKVTNNVLPSGATFSASGGTIDYNLSSSASIRGTHGVSGTPSYSGGANPAAYADFALAAGSPGKNAASDGTDMGINISVSSEKANLWVDSDGGTCARATTAAAYSDSAACGSFNAAYAAASGGDTILVKAGSYSSFSANGTKSSRVIIKAAENENVSLATSNIDTTGGRNKNFTLSNMTLSSVTLGSHSTNGSLTNVSILNSTINGQIDVLTDDADGANILIDGNKFMPWNATGGREGRLSVSWPGGPGTQADSGVTVSNNEFVGPGCSDAIQLGAAAVKVLNNVIHGLRQGSCGPHVDSLQMYGSQRTVIKGNFIYDSDVGIAAYDGEKSPVVEDNVIMNIDRDDECIALGNTSSPTVRHNTLLGDCTINFGSKSGGLTTNVTVQDNIVYAVITSGDVQTATYALNDHNMVRSGTPVGTGSIKATPVYVGGASPTTYAGFALAAGSPGKGVASDGLDMGIRVSGGGTGGGTKVGDFNTDGVVNIYDLGIFLSKWQSTSAAAQDLNGDGIVNIYDLGVFLSHYGS